MSHRTVHYKVEGDGAIKQKDDGRTKTVNDLVGGRVTVSHTTLKQSPLSQEREDRYCYGEFGKLESVRYSASSPSDAPSCEGAPDSDDVRYDFDAFDRLVRAKKPQTGSGTNVQRATTRTYSYDGLDRRDVRCKGEDLELPSALGTVTCSGGDRTEYQYIGTSKALAAEVGDQTRRFDYDSKGEVLGYQQDAKYRTYEKDAQGTIIGLEGDGGQIANEDKYVYDPYGELQPKTDSQPALDPITQIPVPPDPSSDTESSPTGGYSADAQANPLRFQGFYYDSGVKLYDMQAREYRPTVGQFLTPDRFESSASDFNLQADPLTQNRYAFGGGNPIDNIEFDGHEPASSFTNPCDPMYGSAWACARKAPARDQAQAAVDRMRFSWAVSRNWAEGRRSSPKADKDYAKWAATAVHAQAATKGPYTRWKRSDYMYADKANALLSRGEAPPEPANWRKLSLPDRMDYLSYGPGARCVSGVGCVANPELAPNSGPTKARVNGAINIVSIFAAGGDLVAAGRGAVSALRALSRGKGEEVPLEPYAVGRGHHIPAKSAFRGAPGYDVNKALAIPKAYLERRKIDHNVVTGAQASLYTELAGSGRPLTWQAVSSIEATALVRAGVSRGAAEGVVNRAVSALQAAGVSGPTRIPWDP